jgi:hypothetical protein
MEEAITCAELRHNLSVCIDKVIQVDYQTKKQRECRINIC